MILTRTIQATARFDELDVILNQFPNEFRVIMRQNFLATIAPNLLTALRYTPGRVVYLIQWGSEKQRRAFFATNGFGKGIPYRRTGKLQSGWVVDVSIESEGILITADNPADYRKFVTGRRMQPFHKNTGWKPTYPILTEYKRITREHGRQIARQMLRGG